MVHDVVHFVNSLGDAHKLMRALEKCFMHTKLGINSSKTNTMFVKSLNKDKTCIMYNNQPLELWKALSTLALKILSLKSRWNECSNHCLQWRKRVYYTFETIRNHREIK